MKHKHADLYMDFALEAQTNDKPWLAFEWYSDGNAMWYPCNEYICFDKDTEFRIKPKTININGFEVPEHVNVQLALNTIYFWPTLGVYDTDLWDSSIWNDDPLDKRLLKKGLVYLSQEAAEIHAKALLSFTAKP